MKYCVHKPTDKFTHSRTHDRTDGQPENIMPPPPMVGAGIKMNRSEYS